MWFLYNAMLQKICIFPLREGDNGSIPYKKIKLFGYANSINFVNVSLKYIAIHESVFLAANV